jgi:hypothetical protein
MMRSTQHTRWRADRGRVSGIASDLVAITSVNPSLGGLRMLWASDFPFGL